MSFLKGVSFINKVSAARFFTQLRKFYSSLPPEAGVRRPQLDERFLFRFIQHGIFTNISRLTGEPPIAFTPFYMTSNNRFVSAPEQKGRHPFPLPKGRKHGLKISWLSF
jgi:hypothetical protein